MFYLIALPVAALLYHSVNVLLKQYVGREPLWLKTYALASLAYFVAIPSLFVRYVSVNIGLSNETSAYAMAIVGTIILVVTIRFAPTKDKEKTRELN